ncbi:hypothetical protein [Falsiroseomonas ponticola]|uniref:hypothetical protein n=1 Tax=Falsiroseomonas ponticola TaxID=2786951 RepID=UPI0019324C97|nr:hypothetical protein [Roseomonas ponticola]
MPSRAGWNRLPILVRFLLSHALVGFGISAIFTAGFVLANPGGAGGILLNAAGHWWPVVALWFFAGLTFGSVQIGAATMLLAERPEKPRGPRGGNRAPAPILAPVPVPVRR